MLAPTNDPYIDASYISAVSSVVIADEGLGKARAEAEATWSNVNHTRAILYRLAEIASAPL